MLWSRSALARRDSHVTLAVLADSASPVMVIKGAGRIALNPANQRSRVSHDIDILVRPDRIASALDILEKHGWQSFDGTSYLRAKSKIAEFRSMNFFRGKYGNIDLHKSAYFPLQSNSEDDQNLWQRAVGVQFDKVSAVAPSSADQIAIAIAHGSLSAHAHSDWLVDIASVVLRDNNIEWNDLIVTLERRKLLVSAASALTYLALETGTQIPRIFLEQLIKLADGTGLIGRLALFESKPRQDLSAASSLGRGVLKQIRLFREKSTGSSASHDQIWRAWRLRRDRGDSRNGPANVAAIALPPDTRNERHYELEIIIRMNFPPVRRRIELELSAGAHHLARLRYLKTSRDAGPRELRFRGKLSLPANENNLILESRPSRNVPRWRNAEDASRYSALEFEMIGISINPIIKSATLRIDKDIR